MTNRRAGMQIVLISALALIAAKVNAGPLPQATAAGRAAATPTPTPPQKREGHAGPAAAAAPALAAPPTSASSSTAIFNTPHPIASMTADERMRLPDTTMVKLESGRTASLGTLRAEHRARLDRFTRASALGQMTAGKLVQPAASSAQPNPAATTKARSATGPAAKSGLANPGVPQPRVLAKFLLVPMQIPSFGGTIPKDYVDFCKAAKATACIYLPPSTQFTMLQDSAQDTDPLIVDANVCKYDGGQVDLYGCRFNYPVNHLVNFKPTGPVSSTASCDPPSKYVVDPKGAAKASYPYPNSFTTGGTPITCVVQVWVSP